MATPLYASLRDELVALTQSIWVAREPLLAAHEGPSALQPLDAEQLRQQVTDVWARTSGSGEPSTGKRIDVLRSTLEMVARDVAVRPIMDAELPEPESTASDADKARFQTALQDRLDTVLTLFEVVFAANPSATPALETGHLFVPLLEEYPELLLASTWHGLFGYVETRAPRFTKDMPVAKGKQLSLLRLINSFLRVLSHTPADLELRGRVQLFASRAINIADKSAINLRGEYSRVVTTWEEEPAESKPEEAAGDGDVEMADAADKDKDKPKSESKESSPAQPDFYSTLWSLQQYFAHPPSLDGPATGTPPRTPFESFRTKSDFVLSRMFEATRKERVLLGKNPERAAAARKRPHADLERSYPRYLTSRSLLEYEIADPSFRRQILVQYFILFQFLLNLTKESANKQNSTGGMPKSFVLEGDNLAWVGSTARTIRQEMRRMEPDGPELDFTVGELMNRERRYATWKNESCPESDWDLTPADTALARDAAAKWKRHCGPMRRWPYALGTPALTRLWDSKYAGMRDFLGDPVRSETVFTLEERLREVEAEEEDEKAFGREPGPEVAEQKRTINWLALRQARRTYPRFVAAQGMDYDLHKLVAAIRENEARLAAKLAGGAEAGEGDGAGEAEAEAEAEAGEEEAEATAEAEGDTAEAVAEAAENAENAEAAEEETTDAEATVEAEGAAEGEAGETEGNAEGEAEPGAGASGEGTPAQGDVEAAAEANGHEVQDGSASPKPADETASPAKSASGSLSPLKQSGSASPVKSAESPVKAASRSASPAKSAPASGSASPAKAAAEDGDVEMKSASGDSDELTPPPE